MCVCCNSSRLCIVLVLFVCISDEPSVSCVWLHLIEVCFLFSDKGHKFKLLECVLVCSRAQI